MKKIASATIIFFILVLALFVRVYRLDRNLPALYADEVGGGYTSYVYLQEPATSFPDFLYRNFYRRLVMFTWLFGLTPLGVRLPSAIYGTLLLFIFYLFIRQIDYKEIKNQDLIPLITLILLSFVPWGIHLSRIGHPFVLLFLLTMSLHWILYIKAKSPREYIISILPLFFAAWCYPSGIILGPLFILLLMLKKRKKYLRQEIKIIFFLIIIAIGIFVLLLPRSGARGFDLAIWRDVNVTANEDLDRGLARLSSPSIFSLNKDPDVVGKLFYNYPLAVVRVFMRNYLSFFSPDFLFLKGDPVLRYSTGRFGVLYPMLLPFLVYGIFLMATKGDPKIKEMFFFWIMVAPIPAAITKDGAGYLLRVTTMLPLLTCLSALGFIGSLEFFSKKIRILYFLSISFLFVFSVYSFLFNYFHVYPAKAAKSFEYGFKQLADWQKEENLLPLLIIWDGYYPRFYFAFWQPTFFKKLNRFVVKKIEVDKSVFYQAAENLYFSLPKEETDLKMFLEEKKIFFLALPVDLRESFSRYQLFQEKPVKSIEYPDRTPVFYLYQISH